MSYTDLYREACSKAASLEREMVTQRRVIDELREELAEAEATIGHMGSVVEVYCDGENAARAKLARAVELLERVRLFDPLLRRRGIICACCLRSDAHKKDCLFYGLADVAKDSLHLAGTQGSRDVFTPQQAGGEKACGGEGPGALGVIAPPGPDSPDVPFGPTDICPYCGVAGPGPNCWDGHRATFRGSGSGADDPTTQRTK